VVSQPTISQVLASTSLVLAPPGPSDVFDKRQLKGRKARIQQVVNGELTGKATREAIEAMQAAVMVACIIPAIVVSTTAGH
jgi:hypothetical protein